MHENYNDLFINVLRISMTNHITLFPIPYYSLRGMFRHSDLSVQLETNELLLFAATLEKAFFVSLHTSHFGIKKDVSQPQL